MIILFYPDPLDNYKRYSRVLRILENCEWVDFHNDPSKAYDLHIFWSYTRDRIEPPELTLKDKIVLNRGCWDISKKKVNKIFNDISIDPRTHKGIAVEKREWQGGHKWHSIVKCPREPKPGYIYQRVINNREGNYFVRYRIFLMGGVITHVNKRYETDRFITSTKKVENITVNDFFSPAEKKDFLNKCTHFGIDFGELDILTEGKKKIVIDVNNMVGGKHPGILARSKPYKEIDQSFLEYLKKTYNDNSRITGME